MGTDPSGSDLAGWGRAGQDAEQQERFLERSLARTKAWRPPGQGQRQVGRALPSLAEVFGEL